MAKKRSSKKNKKRGGRRRRGIFVLFALLLIVAGAVIAAMMFKPTPEKPIQAMLGGRLGKGQGAGPGQLSSPRGIAADSKGRVFAADLGNDRIVVFKAD